MDELLKQRVADAESEHVKNMDRIIKNRQNEIGLELLHTTLNSIGDGIVATDLKGNITFLNPVSEQLTGWTMAEAIGKYHEDIFKIINEHSRAIVKSPIKEALAKEKIVFLENHTLLVSKNGRETPIEDSASPIRNDDSTIVGAVLVFRDVTQRKESERELRRSEEFNRTILASSSDCIQVLDMEGRILSINEGGCRQLELDDMNICIHKEWSSFWGNEEAGKAQAALDMARAGKIGRFEGYCTTFKNTPKWWEVIVTPIKDTDGTIIRLLSVSRDITDRKQADSQLQLTYEDLEKATIDLKRSNEDLEHFARTASHDLKSPLNAITQLSQLLEMKYKDRLGEDANLFIHTIVDCATSMRVLIDDLITYSRVSGEEGKTEQKNSSEVALGKALVHLKKAIDDSHAVITHDALPELELGSTHILQLFQNLIGNAIHYRGAETPRIHVSAERKSGFHLFSISDNGIGIAEEQRENIFEPFKRLHGADKPGSGIGLASCRKIVERAQGRIWVDSVEGQGSTFHFTIPE